MLEVLTFFNALTTEKITLSLINPILSFPLYVYRSSNIDQTCLFPLESKQVHDFSDSFMASAKDTKAADLEKAFKSLEEGISESLIGLRHMPSDQNKK